MKCKKCGKDILEDWKYCNFCGANLEEFKEDDLDDKQVKKSFFSTHKYLIVASIITLLLSIIIYFCNIDIMYYLEYGDVEDFFDVLLNIVKIVFINIFVIGISVLVSQNYSEKIVKYVIMSFCIITCMFCSLLSYEPLNVSNQSSTETSDYTYTSSTTSYSTSMSDSKYCEAYGCAREKEHGYKYCDKHLEDPNWQPSYAPSSSSSNSTYSKYHKCEYPGCTNYASETKYCSVHNQTKCSRPGCSKKEAYNGAGLCIEHITEALNY